MKKLIVLSVIGALFLTSCSSGWSCKKRYVDQQKKETTTQKQIKNS